MYFIVGFPKVGNMLVIMVVVDCLSKYDDFCALPHPLTPTLVEHVFLVHIFKLRGMPISTVYDRDPNFTNTFLQEFHLNRRAPNWTWAQPITPSLSTKKKWSTNVCKPTCGVFLRTKNTSGCNGSTWNNGGTTIPIIWPLKWPHMKQCMEKTHL